MPSLIAFKRMLPPPDRMRIAPSSERDRIRERDEQTDRQTEERIAASLYAPLRYSAGHNNYGVHTSRRRRNSWVASLRVGRCQLAMNYPSFLLCWWRGLRRRPELLRGLPTTTGGWRSSTRHSCCRSSSPLDPWRRRPLVTPGNPRRTLGHYTCQSRRLDGSARRLRSVVRTLHQFQQTPTEIWHEANRKSYMAYRMVWLPMTFSTKFED